MFPLSIYVYIYTAHLSYAESLQNTAAAIDFFVNRVSYQLSKLSDKKYFCLINEILKCKPISKLQILIV